VTERDAFLEENWEEMRKRMETDGPRSTAEFIQTFADSDRKKLYFFAQRAFGGRSWDGKSLDKTAEIVELGIVELVRQSEAETDPTRSTELLDYANILSFNLSADLADCWPGDDAERNRGHFERGLAAASNCLQWRKQLRKGPGPFSMAWWAKGMHELSLSRSADAFASFVQSRDYSREQARAGDHGHLINADGHWSVLLGEGYVGIAAQVSGKDEGRSILEAAFQALEEALEKQPAAKGDIEFCTAQLKKVQSRYLVA